MGDNPLIQISQQGLSSGADPTSVCLFYLYQRYFRISHTNYNCVPILFNNYSSLHVIVLDDKGNKSSASWNHTLKLVARLIVGSESRSISTDAKILRKSSWGTLSQNAADVWKKDVWDFQALSSQTFLYFFPRK